MERCPPPLLSPCPALLLTTPILINYKNMNQKKKMEECSTNVKPSKLSRVELKMEEEIVNSTNTSMGDNDTNSGNDKVDDDLIYSGDVSDRRLFYDATDGDLWKYKYSVELLDPASPHKVWVGVSGKTFPIRHYITTRNIEGELSTIFLDHGSRNIVKTACASFLRHDDPNHEWGNNMNVSHDHPLHFGVDNDCLIITHRMKQSHPVSLTKEEVIQLIDKDWLLHRFTKYLHNKLILIEYGEDIITTNTSPQLSRSEFEQRWLNPPNRTLPSDDVWTLLKKKYSLVNKCFL